MNAGSPNSNSVKVYETADSFFVYRELLAKRIASMSSYDNGNPNIIHTSYANSSTYATRSGAVSTYANPETDGRQIQDFFCNGIIPKGNTK